MKYVEIKGNGTVSLECHILHFQDEIEIGEVYMDTKTQEEE